MEKNVIKKTGNTVVTDNVIESVLFVVRNAHQRALDCKKSGKIGDYWQELSYYLGMKNALEFVGLVVKENYDFNDLEA